jgi:hypothetical protein
MLEPRTRTQGSDGRTARALRRVAGALGTAVALLGTAPPAYASSALGAIAPEIVKGLGALPASAVVVAAPLVTDQTAPKGDELGVRIAQLVAGKIGGTARPHGKAETLATARATAGKAGALVFLQVELAKGEVRVTADLYPSMANGWDRVRIAAPAPLAHAYAAGAVDAEVRAFLTPVLLEQASLHRVKHDEGEVLAVGCGDLDGDGGMEVALVSRARVALGRVKGGKFVIARAAPWSALSPHATVPLREPLAGVVFRGPGAVLVGTTDRVGVRLDAALAPQASFAGVPVPLAKDGGCAHASGDSQIFEGDVTACAPPEDARPTVLASPPGRKFDAFASADIVQRDGTTRAIWADREPGGKLRIRYGDQSLAVEGAGAQLAVGDLDLDGIPEIVTTNDGAVDDVILVSSWTPQGLRQRARIVALQGVRAIGVCPPEERGVPALVAVVGGELWLWR